MTLLVPLTYRVLVGTESGSETWPAECGQPGPGGAECVKRKPGFDRSNDFHIEHPPKSHFRYVSANTLLKLTDPAP